MPKTKISPADLKEHLKELKAAQCYLAKLCDLGVLSDSQESDYFADFLYSKGLDWEKYEELLEKND